MISTTGKLRSQSSPCASRDHPTGSHAGIRSFSFLRFSSHNRSSSEKQLVGIRDWLLSPLYQSPPYYEQQEQREQMIERCGFYLRLIRRQLASDERSQFIPLPQQLAYVLAMRPTHCFDHHSIDKRNNERCTRTGLELTTSTDLGARFYTQKNRAELPPSPYTINDHTFWVLLLPFSRAYRSRNKKTTYRTFK